MYMFEFSRPNLNVSKQNFWDLNCLKLNPRVTFECHIQQYIYIYTEKQRKYCARA